MSDHSPSAAANLLTGSSSPYLQSAAHQPVAWLPWGEEAFLRASAENKPLLLDIGAVWCHWCHVMDGESYENGAIAELINKEFIAVKVDRDERPDVDARYQRAVQAMTGQGGWPLTAFLTSSGVPFYGGTYFPPEARFGRPGFSQVLRTVAAAYRDNHAQVEEQASALGNYLRESRVNSCPSEISESVLVTAMESIVGAFDETHGGFGTAPKFPHPTAIEFLLARNARLHNENVMHVIAKTLHAMGNGGMYDQLGGGFHRYSTDERWLVPHFEKMLYDNSELLRNYVHAFAVLGDPYFRAISEGIITWMDDVLSDRERGGFYGSQDADVTFGDDGTYFTWRMADAQSVLTDDEFTVAQARYNIYADGEMHNDRTQNVLFIDRPVAAIAAETHRDPAAVDSLLRTARAKMLASRAARTTPYVDRTLYVGWNAMAVSAYLDAAIILGRNECRQFAVLTLDRLLHEGFTNDGALRHTLAPDAPTDLLDDHAHLIAALFHAHEVTGVNAYLQRALSSTQTAITKFYDEAEGGFFDRVRTIDATGILDLPHKPIQDSPAPSGNAVMCRNLLAAYWWTEDAAFLLAAETTIRRFLPEAGGFGIFASEFFRAIDEYVHPPTHVAIVGDPNDLRSLALWNAAHALYVNGASITRHDPAAGDEVPVPIQPMLVAFSVPAAFVCSGTQCSAPCRTPEELRKVLFPHG